MPAQRLEKLHALMQREGLEILALVPGPNLLYLTGLSFHLMERPILALIAAGAPPCMVVPELERSKLLDSGLEAEIIAYGEQAGASELAFQRAAQQVGLRDQQIGLEPTGMRYLELSLLQLAAPQAGFHSFQQGLSELRLLKDPGEQQAMQRASQIAEAALQQTLPLVRLGMSELELEAELTLQLLRAGSDTELAFRPIVAGGPHSAHPHATAGDRPLAAGEALILDWGARHGGYVSDITRTFALGEATPELERVHRVVQEANRAGRQAVAPGATCEAVDAAARQAIASAGYAERFIHRTGHGIGLESHEPPYIRADNPQPLEAGMAFTVEPGIYLPGEFGVRIEDNLLVTESGAQTLTSLPRGLQVIA